MVFFSNAKGTNVQIVADPVNQGSTNANEVIFAGPFASSNTVTVTYRTPGGISLTPRVLSLVDGAQIIDGVEYNAWTGLLDAAVTEFAGTVTAMFSITASNGTTIITNPAYFEVHEGVYVEPPADPSADVWGKILTAMATMNERIDNVILTNAKQSKAIADNKAAIEEIDGKVTAHSAQIKDLQDTKLDKQTGETANHMVYAKTPEGAQEMLPFPSGTLANIKDGEPVGSLEQLSSKAQGEYDAAFGSGNTTSVKGYYIAGVYFSDNQTIFILDYTFWPQITVVPTAPVPDEETPTPEWAANDVALFTFSRDVTLTAPIQNVDHNLLYIGKNLENVVPTTRVTDERSNSNSVCIPSKPTAGHVKLTNGGASTGAHNIAAGNNATVSGEGNIAGGDCSDVGGLDCVGNATAAFVRGIGNTATAEGQFVAGRYSKEGQNGLGEAQADSTMIVRIGAGTNGNPKTVFSIDGNGTACMRAGAVPTSSIVSNDNIINKEYADSRYLGKSGGTVSGNVTIQGDLTVAGTTTTETEKQLLVEANVIATNANKQPLGSLLSGLAINKNASDTYGLMYDPLVDAVKFGQGTLDANNQFVFSANEGHPIAIRDDSEKFTDGHFVKWQASSNSFVDAGVDEKTVRPTIGSVGVDQNVLSSIIYTPESSIPTSAIEGVEYACTDLIGEGDLDGDLQTKINSALTQTTADERYVQKGTYTDTILTESAGTVLVMAEGEAVLNIYVGPSFDTSTGLYKAYSNSGQSVTTTASQLAVNDKFFVMPWYTYTAAGPDGRTTYWEAPLYYQVMEKTEQTVGSDKQYFVRVIMHYANKAQ